jgi:hypothetical protein
VREAARDVHELTPEAPPLPPPVVGGVRAEDEQQAEDDPEDAQERGPERHRDAPEIGLDPDDDRRPGAGTEHIEEERAEHRTAREIEEHAQPILRIV